MRKTTRRRWLGAVACSSLSLLSLSASAQAAAALAARPPNVLLMIADDLNTHLGCYCDRPAKTRQQAH